MKPTNAAQSGPRRHPIRRFVLLLTLLMAGFNAAYYLWIVHSRPFHAYLTLNAGASAAILRLLGTEVAADGVRVASSNRAGPEARFALDVKHGCDALQPMAFLVFAILSSPVGVPLHRRVAPILAGSLALLLLNLVRIVTLFYAGLKSARLFDFLHLDVWQAVFIFLPLVLWIGWARTFMMARHAST